MADTTKGNLEVSTSEYARSPPGPGIRLLYKLVKNDSVQVDPPEIYGLRVFLLACSACFGAMLFGFDIGTIGGVLILPAFKVKYKTEYMDKYQAADLNSNITSVLQAGCFLGCFLASWCADRWGRRLALILNGVIAIVGTIFQAAGQGSLASMYVGRFIAGVGVGGASTIVPIYVSENAPRGIRGALTGLYQLFVVTGIMMAFWVNYGSILHLKGDSTYIVPLAMQALPAVLLVVFMLMNHESPRWFGTKERWEEATKVLSIVRSLPASHPYVQAELKDMTDQLERERALVGGSSTKDLIKEMWTVAGNRKRALLSIGLMVCQQMTGTNAINYYAPLLFKSLGLQGTNTNLFATGIYGVVKVIACCIFLVVAVDSLGRRRSLLWTSIAQGSFMYYMGIYIRVAPPKDGQSIPPAGYVGLVCIFLFAAAFQFGWGPVPWVYVSEIPAARLRSQNVAIAAATQWLFNFVVAKSTPLMLVTVGNGGYGTFFIYGSFCFSMFFFVWFFIPETKGLSLERMDELFGATNVKRDEENNQSSSPISPPK